MLGDFFKGLKSVGVFNVPGEHGVPCVISEDVRTVNSALPDGVPKSLDMHDRDVPKFDSNKEAMKHFEKWLDGHHVRVMDAKVRMDKLKPIQKTVSREVTDSISGADALNYDDPILTTRDGYIMDGHHRFVAQWDRDGMSFTDGEGEDGSMRCRVIDLELNDALELVKDYPRIKYRDQVKTESVKTESYTSENDSESEQNQNESMTFEEFKLLIEKKMHGSSGKGDEGDENLGLHADWDSIPVGDQSTFGPFGPGRRNTHFKFDYEFDELKGLGLGDSPSDETRREYLKALNVYLHSHKGIGEISSRDRVLDAFEAGMPTLDKPMVVWRGTSTTRLNGKNQVGTLIGKNKKGKVWYEDFTSTSSDLQVAKNFASRGHYNLDRDEGKKAYVVMMEFHMKPGARVIIVDEEPVPNEFNENEVILDRKSMFKVVSREKKTAEQMRTELHIDTYDGYPTEYWWVVLEQIK